MTTQPQNERSRLSLTNKQQQSEAGLELIALCHTVTEDGTISISGAEELRLWLERCPDLNVPAIIHLRQVVRTIASDGIITEMERTLLYETLEKIMPVEVRVVLKERRKAAQAKLNGCENDSEKTTKLRRLPIRSWEMYTAGVRYEGRPEIIRQEARVDQKVRLVRDHDNPYSRNAISIVLASGRSIGFVPETDAPDIAKYLDAGHPHTASIKTILARGAVPIPVIKASVYRTDSMLSESIVSPALAEPAKATGCCIALAVGVAGAVAGSVLLWA